MSNGFIKYPPMGGGSVFTPQVAPYNAMQDIFKIYMQDYRMRMQRESQVLNMMQQLDPVQLFGDQVRLDQYNMIKEFDDYATNLVYEKKGRLNTDDMFNLQHRIIEIEKWQDKQLAQVARVKEETKIFNAAEPGYYDEDYFYTHILDTINNGNYHNTYLKVKPLPSTDEFLTNYRPIDDKNMRTIKTTELSADKTKRINYITKKWGLDDIEQDEVLKGNLLTGEYFNNERLRACVERDFNSDNYTTEAERMRYMEEAERLNRNKKVGDPVSGVKKDSNIAPSYLWLMDYKRGKIQQPITNPAEERTYKYEREPIEPEHKLFSTEGESKSIRGFSPNVKAKTRDVVYSFDSPKNYTDGLPTGSKAIPIKIEDDFFITSVPDATGWSDIQLGRPGSSLGSYLRNQTYQLIELETGDIDVYEGGEVEINKLIYDVPLEEKTKIGGMLEKRKNVTFHDGMPISDDLKIALGEKAKEDNEDGKRAQKILDSTNKRKVAKMTLKVSGVGGLKTIEGIRRLDAPLAGQLGITEEKSDKELIDKSFDLGEKGIFTYEQLKSAGWTDEEISRLKIAK